MPNALSKLNFRDLGGLSTADGRKVRHGIIYRSEGPASFVDEHRAELGALGVRTVCDLRSKTEREAAPNDWCGPNCRVLNLDMNTDLRVSHADFWETLRHDHGAENARSALLTNYGTMPTALRAHFPRLIDTLLAREVPMIVHCTAGKDRTGVAIALLLSLLGVTREQVMLDYGRSDVFGQNMRVAGSVEDAFRKSYGFVPSPQAMAMLMGTDPEFVLAALQAVEHEWGSVEAYFSSAGVGSDRQEQLRAMLLTE
jgi:protein-tyrosine phosphatase